MKGFLISFEGIDGSGKSTQAELLYTHLVDHGYTARLLREPGGTDIGERIRSLLLDSAFTEMAPYTELFLYLAARAQICSQVITPALERAEVVIMDRFIDSSSAYQGYARGLGVVTVEELNSIAAGGVVPDMTFFVDCDPATALSRVDSKPDRLESEGLTFMERVREGFLQLCFVHKDRFILIDGEQPVDTINRLIISEMSKLFDASNR